MTNEELKNMLFIIDTLLDDAITDSTRQKVKDNLTEVCQLAMKALEQQPFINKPCISKGVCREDKIQVLDKIRAEIEKLRLHKAEFLTSDNKVCIDSQEVLNIIDKYRTESEGAK